MGTYVNLLRSSIVIGKCRHFLLSALLHYLCQMTRISPSDIAVGVSPVSSLGVTLCLSLSRLTYRRRVSRINAFRSILLETLERRDLLASDLFDFGTSLAKQTLSQKAIQPAFNREPAFLSAQQHLNEHTDPVLTERIERIVASSTQTFSEESRIGQLREQLPSITSIQTSLLGGGSTEDLNWDRLENGKTLSQSSTALEEGTVNQLTGAGSLPPSLALLNVIPNYPLRVTKPESARFLQSPFNHVIAGSFCSALLGS